MSATIVKFYKDGHNMSVSTNASSEEEFMAEAVKQLSEIVQRREYDNDWEYQLQRWLPQIVDVCCKLRGYKAAVHEERVIVAGYHMPTELIQAFAKTR